MIANCKSCENIRNYTCKECEEGYYYFQAACNKIVLNQTSSQADKTDKITNNATSLPPILPGPIINTVDSDVLNSNK